MQKRVTQPLPLRLVSFFRSAILWGAWGGICGVIVLGSWAVVAATGAQERGVTPPLPYPHAPEPHCHHGKMATDPGTGQRFREYYCEQESLDDVRKIARYLQPND